MSRTRILASLLVAACSLDAGAQSPTGADKWADSARREIDAASLRGDAARLQSARVLLDRALVAFPGDGMLLHYQGYAIYRQLYLDTNASADEQAAKSRLAQDYLEKSITKKPLAESWVLLTALYGRQISADPSLGQTLGMEIQRATGAATALGATNPRVHLIAAQGALYTPPEWGGGPAVAERSVRQAIALFESDHPQAPLPAWGRAEAYAWLGQVQEKLGRKEDALAAYRKSLEIEPEYSWVKRVLLPALEKSGSR